MDSTNTFHLLVGEPMLDPVTFTMITGVACAGEPVPFDRCLEPMSPDRAGYIERLLGMILAMKATHTVKFDLILTHMLTSGQRTSPLPGRSIKWSEPSSFIYWAPLSFVMWPARWISSF